MSKCNKIKNPCKICLGPVSHKNGLQCQGACESWVHYACLNYTPGRIKDIKKGIIKVTCPCPDCKTAQIKEYRTDDGFICNNSLCPANHPPKCENTTCPTNKGKTAISNQSPCPILKCGNACKKHSHPQLPNTTQPNLMPPCAPNVAVPKSTSDARLDYSRCSSGCTNASSDIPGDIARRGTQGAAMPSMDVVEQMCNTVGQLTNQINELMCKMKQMVTDQGGNGVGCGPNTNKPCPQQGPRSQCPKPCYCPGNPALKK